MPKTSRISKVDLQPLHGHASAAPGALQTQCQLWGWLLSLGFWGNVGMSDLYLD